MADQDRPDGRAEPEGGAEPDSGPPRFPPVNEPSYPPFAWPPSGGGAMDNPPPPPPGYSPPPGYPGYGQGYGSSSSGYAGGGSSHWLHPIDVGRAFSAGWRLYRFNWRSVVIASVAVTLVTLGGGLLLGLLAGPALIEWFSQYQAAVLRRDLSELPLPPAAFWALIPAGIALIILQVVSTVAVVHILDAGYRGQKQTAREGLSVGLRRIPTILAIGLIYLGALIALSLILVILATVLALIGFAIGGAGLAVFLALIGYVGSFAAYFFVIARWSLFVQTMVVERLGARAALGRSWRLVAGSTWRVFGYLFLVALTGIGVALVLGIPGLIIQPRFTSPSSIAELMASMTSPVYLGVQLATGLVAAAITPWFASIMTLLYYDLRWRRGELNQQPASSTAAPTSYWPTPGG